MSNPTIILLAGKGSSTNILYHALKDEFPITAIILEEPESKKQFLKKRVRRLGLWKVIGQVFFQLFIVKFLELVSLKRKRTILRTYAMNDSSLPANLIIPVRSVNDAVCMEQIEAIAPDLIIVNGTRIISKQVLGCVTSKFVNIHAGITPMYRGVHGAYWALVNNDRKNCGVTVHLVDAGIDTGGVIAQCPITVSAADNFVTYPLLQIATGIPLMKKAIDDILNNRLVLLNRPGISHLWSHPTFTQYIYYRIVKGKK